MSPEIIVYCDGACEPCNPHGYATWGWAAFIDGKEINRNYGYIGHGEGMSNNLAEYTAVLEALRRAKAKGVAIHIKTDSQLVVKQVLGQWSVKAEHLLPYRNEAAALLKETGSSLTWIPREENTRADELSRLAYRKARKDHAYGTDRR